MNLVALDLLSLILLNELSVVVLVRVVSLFLSLLIKVVNIVVVLLGGSWSNGLFL